MPWSVLLPATDPFSREYIEEFVRLFERVNSSLFYDLDVKIPEIVAAHMLARRLRDIGDILRGIDEGKISSYTFTINLPMTSAREDIIVTDAEMAVMEELMEIDLGLIRRALNGESTPAIVSEYTRFSSLLLSFGKMTGIPEDVLLTNLANWEILDIFLHFIGTRRECSTKLCIQTAAEILGTVEMIGFEVTVIRSLRRRLITLRLSVSIEK